MEDESTLGTSQLINDAEVSQVEVNTTENSIFKTGHSDGVAMFPKYRARGHWMVLIFGQKGTVLFDILF